MVARSAGLLKWIAFVTGLSACEAERVPVAAPHPVVGTWVRVYPREGAPDTLILRADGTVGGSVSGIDSAHFQYTRWKVGDVHMPGGFCIGEGDQPNGQRLWACQGFYLTSDTLALANQKRTLFLRVDASGKRVVDTAWANPRDVIAAPRPGDSVKVVPPDSAH